MSFHNWLMRREIGLLPHRGDQDFIMRGVFKSITPYHQWEEKPPSEYGAVFNLEFSPEGNVLVGACEKKCILLFDAISTKQTNKIMDAHTDNVNCIKFLDNRMFATCSDDQTVALWDLRFLKRKVRSLNGHSNWVKNIEYSHKDRLLVTSGFDGSIFTWDINSHTEQGLIYQKVFHTSGLMRCRISPDSTKLVICTTGGYLMIIHDLDLTTLHKDLSGFRPSIYRLMQMGQQYIPQAAKFDHVFSKQQLKNRVELVTDFPEKNDAEVILALQIHPRGHSILSRNISYDENSEWSCVHDLNEEPGDITEQAKECCNKRKRKLKGDCDSETGEYDVNQEGSGDSTDEVLFNLNRRRRIAPTGSASSLSPPTTSGSGSTSASTSNTAAVGLPAPGRQESFVPDIWAAEVTVQERASRQNRARTSNSVTGYNFVYAISSGVLPAQASMRTQQTTLRPNFSLGHAVYVARDERRVMTSSYPANNANNNNTNDGGSSTSSSDSPPYLQQERSPLRPMTSPLYSTATAKQTKPRQIFQNAKKLMYYIQESNKGKGFIKEPCFSSDGRIICSPYDIGVRLLSFSDSCSEYPFQGARQSGDERIPQRLVEVKTIKAHSDTVLCSKFSPREPLLVTGCRSGSVVWYHPNL